MKNDTLQRIEMAESLGWAHYASGHNATAEQKAAAKWWNNADPAELVDLPSLAELSALDNVAVREPSSVPARSKT